jgi:hypothetical protein
MQTVAFLLLASALQAEGFYPIEERQGIKVFRHDTDRGIELGAEGDFPASPARVLAVLLDYANHPRWVRGLKESRILQRGDHWLDVYQRLDLPLIEDRDFTLRVSWGEHDGVTWLRFHAANERGPEAHKGVVRVPTHDGEWQLAPIDGGKATHAVYRFHLDLAGSFPAWMGRGKAGRDMPKLFGSIKQQL